MAKRGRKPKNDGIKGYFLNEQEEAFVNYINASTKEEKDKIFNKFLLPAFTKMTESIIRRYNLFIPDESFQETFDDAISFLMTKINNFNQNSNFKAYSYTGTIIKNYLIYKINTFNKSQKRNMSYENMNTEINDNLKFSSEMDENRLNFLNEIIFETSQKINEMIDNKDEYALNNDEVLVGKALINLLTNWDVLFENMGSNKFNKSSVLLYLKDLTNMDTKTVRNGMKKYKELYYDIKKKMME